MSDNNFFGTTDKVAALAIMHVINKAQAENWNWEQTELRLYNMSQTDGLWDLREGRVTREVKKYLFG